MSASEPDDEQLWKQALQGVDPLTKPPRIQPPSKRRFEARQFAEDERRVMPDAMSETIEPEEFDAGDETTFRQDGVSRQQIRKLRRGEFSIQGCADLHGQTRAEAAENVRALLEAAEQHNWRCVKIIHGKGLGSPNGRPVLKNRVEIALRRNNRVLAYASAPPWSGGHGATLVLLKASR